MRPQTACIAALLLLAPVAPSLAETPDELERLPARGELKPDEMRAAAGTLPPRLRPGGGLLLSFDANGDGRIDADEIARGTALAFAAADADASGHVTILEQADWARSLPTRDETLANPTRFDPNLDRRVSPEEFAGVISALAADYAGEDGGVIEMSALKAPEPKAEPRERRERPLRPDRARY